MRAVLCRAFGPIDDLSVEELDPPPCGPGSVRVKVTACGVNFVDGLFVEGRYQIKPPLPFIPGSEIAGVVVETGEGVDGVAPGDRVLASTNLGGFSDEVVVPAAALLPVPGRLTDGQAATFVQSYLTGWFALRVRAGARAGQSMLVLGAGSGVGLAAVDIGQALGLQVIAGASTAEKRALAEAQGAEASIDTTTEDVKTRARELAGGSGVDLVYDPVGGDLAEQGLRALGDDGQFLVIGFASGSIPKLPANQVLLRNRRVTGVEWGGWVAKHPEENRALVAEVLAEIAAGRLHPVEPTTYPLDEVRTALRDLADRRVTGKVALVP
jgi:NADPH2:quinone reductase